MSEAEAFTLFYEIESRDVRCPKCGSSNVRRTKTGGLVCKNCKHRWQANNDAEVHLWPP